MTERDTREHIDEEERYCYFDEAMDRYQAGEITFEEAIAEYQQHIGQTAVAGSAD